MPKIKDKDSLYETIFHKVPARKLVDMAVWLFNPEFMRFRHISKIVPYSEDTFLVEIEPNALKIFRYENGESEQPARVTWGGFKAMVESQGVNDDTPIAAIQFLFGLDDEASIVEVFEGPENAPGVVIYQKFIH